MVRVQLLPGQPLQVLSSQGKNRVPSALGQAIRVFTAATYLPLTRQSSFQSQVIKTTGSFKLPGGLFFLNEVFLLLIG